MGKKNKKSSKKLDPADVQRNMEEHPEYAYTLVDDQQEEEEVEEVVQGPSKTQASWAGRLASNDLNVRTKTLGILEAHLAKPETEMSSIDLMKIWKGLFYALWAADGRQVQNDLSDRLANLIHSHPSHERMLEFLHAGLTTMDVEWGGIDELRLDKYYYFVRRLLNELFEYIKNNNYDEEIISSILKTVQEDIFSPQSESNLSTHFCDVYLDELHSVFSEEKISDEIWAKLGVELFVDVLTTVELLTPPLVDRIDQYLRDLCKAAVNFDDEFEEVEIQLTVFPIAACVDILFKAASTKEEIMPRYRNLLYKIHGFYKNAAPRQARLQANLDEKLAAEAEEEDIEREAKELLEKEEAAGAFLSKKQRKRLRIREKPEELARKAHEAVNGENGEANPDKKRKKKKQRVEESAPVLEEVEVPAEPTNGKKKKNKKNKQQPQPEAFVPVKEEPADEPMLENVNGNNKKKNKNKKQRLETPTSATEPIQVEDEDVPVVNGTVAKKGKKDAKKRKQQPQVEVEDVQVDTSIVEEINDLPVKKRTKAKLLSTNANGHHAISGRKIKTRSATAKLKQQDDEDVSIHAKIVDEASLVTPTTTPHKSEKKTPKSLLKTPTNNVGSSSKKNVRWSQENSVKEFFKESTIGLGTKLTF